MTELQEIMNEPKPDDFHLFPDWATPDQYAELRRTWGYQQAALEDSLTRLINHSSRIVRWYAKRTFRKILKNNDTVISNSIGDGEEMALEVSGLHGDEHGPAT